MITVEEAKLCSHSRWINLIEWLKVLGPGYYALKKNPYAAGAHLAIDVLIKLAIKIAEAKTFDSCLHFHAQKHIRGEKRKTIYAHETHINPDGSVTRKRIRCCRKRVPGSNTFPESFVPGGGHFGGAGAGSSWGDPVRVFEPSDWVDPLGPLVGENGAVLPDGFISYSDALVSGARIEDVNFI